MLINSGHRLDCLRTARDEMRAFAGRTPGPDFYERKLAQVWDRARYGRAYAGIGPYSPEAFAALPPLAKDRLKRAAMDFATIPVDGAAKYYETTGTTGRPTITPRTAEDIIWNTVSVAEAWRRLLPDGDRVAIIMPSDVVPVGDLISGVCEYLGLVHGRMYPFATGICDWDRLFGLWRNLRPTTVFVAPGVAQQMIRLLHGRGDVEGVTAHVERLMLLGEVSTAPFRARLREWWRAEAYDASYGSTETGTLAASCPRGRLHLLTGANYFELATGDGIRPLPDAAAGRLVVTPLNLHARPLLRLDTGDDVRVRDDCGCGNRTPVVEVAGRAADAPVIRGVQLTPRAVEELVYSVAGVSGYMIQTDRAGRQARLVLERGVGWNREREPQLRAELGRASARALGLDWDRITFVNSLSVLTKSGASQKSWKRTNVQLLDEAVR
jgi:phenylacetate-CoA ligase